MEHVAMGLKAVFVITTLLAVYLFYRASNQSKVFLLLVLTWMAIQLCLGLAGFYQDESTTPPRFILLILPPFLLIAGVFLTSKGKKFMDGLDLRQLTLLHSIRIPVEIVLYYLFIANTIPKIMTFEGRNFDILSGLTAPLIYFRVYCKEIFKQHYHYLECIMFRTTDKHYYPCNFFRQNLFSTIRFRPT